MKMIVREKSLLMDKADLEELYRFSHFPVFMGTTEEDTNYDKKEDMIFTISKSNGLIQLKNCIPEEFLYSKSHNNSLGKVWEEHHKAFAKFIMPYHLNSIFEIGGGNGRLEVSFHEINGTPIDWTIIEPSPVKKRKETRANYMYEFFDEHFKLPDNLIIDAVVHTHVLEHIYSPDLFLKNCADLLERNGRMFFSIPNIQAQLERKYTNALNFEHTYYLIEPYVEYLLYNNNFEIIERQYYLDDYSIFYAVEKREKVEKKVTFDGLYEKNKKVFLEYIAYYKKLINQLNERINNTTEEIYLFGAHIFSQYLIEFGLDITRIKAILDNDILKQGKRLYGTPLFVQSPKILGGEIGNPVIILKVGSYAQEIKEDIVKHINPNVQFWE